MGKQLDLYNKYFVENGFERLGLFELLRDEFGIESSLYLGSFVDITPAFVFPRAVFVDSDRRVQRFFEDSEVKSFVESSKQYNADSEFEAFQQNYDKSIDIPENSFDLLISQYAGFVSQAGKKYQRDGGILLANNIHGDASLAFLDKEYKFIGVVNSAGKKWSYSNKNISFCLF